METWQLVLSWFFVFSGACTFVDKGENADSEKMWSLMRQHSMSGLVVGRLFALVLLPIVILPAVVPSLVIFILVHVEMEIVWQVLLAIVGFKLNEYCERLPTTILKWSDQKYRAFQQAT